MKWFKHDSNASRDAKIEKLIMRHGVAGYGLYWYCVEIIAGALSPENITFELEHDAEILAHKLQIDTLKVEKIMKDCLELGLFQLNPDTNRIVCLSLARRLDEYTAKSIEQKKIASLSRQYNDKLPTMSDQNRLDKNRLDKNRLDKEKKSAHKFAPPSLPEILSYMNEIHVRNPEHEANQFLNYHSSKGWKVGREPMKDWKAAVRTWKGNQDKWNPQPVEVKENRDEERAAILRGIKRGVVPRLEIDAAVRAGLITQEEADA